MKTINTIYKYGHFYDTHTKQRVTLKDGISLQIELPDADILPTQAVGEASKNLNAKSNLLRLNSLNEKERENIIVIGQKHFRKIFTKGKTLYFTITHRRIKHEFRVELFDDLYFYVSNSTKKKDERLEDCRCVVKNNTTNTLDYFEEIYGKSLNEVYKHTYVHYFENFGAPSVNAFNRFYEELGQPVTTIARHRQKELKGVQELYFGQTK